MLERIYLNKDWEYKDDQGSKKIVTLPHNVKDLAYNYINEEDYQLIATYIKKIKLDKSYQDKHLLLTFEGVAHKADVYINNQLILTHLGGYESFNIDIKDYLNFDKDNEIKVVVDTHEDEHIPPFGNVVDYLTYGGIYRDVYIDVRCEDYVIDAFVKPFHKDNKWGVDIDINLTNAKEYLLEISNENNVIISAKILPNDKNETLSYEIDNAKLWDIDHPNLYCLKLTLDNDIYETTFGIRTIEFKNNGVYLNDKKIKVIGLNRHQSFPYVGYAMPESMQRYDARILKNELHVNAVRTSHYPQSQYFIDECDKLGLLVFTEIPGWQHIGDKAWQEISIRSVSNMIKQYRNHPSIFIWGVRINESKDNHDFYKATNEVAHKLDPTRPTGGVRCFTNMELLEDVYTYNDFLDPNYKRGLTEKSKIVGKKNIDHPYLVSEYCGHMYPTKMFDNEERRVKHALRILKAMETFYGDEEITAWFSWCMFDYNTHKDFGSGDRICYHGMLDMFRNPKTASYVYSSQGKEPYMELSSNYNPGEYDASMIPSVYVFTNADEVKLYRNGVYIRSFSKSDSPYKNIPNPPFLVEDFVGDQLVKNEGYTEKESRLMKQVLLSTIKYGSKMPLKDKLTYLRLMLFHGVTYQKGYELYGKYIGNWGSKEVTYTFEAIKDGKIFKTINLAKPKSGHLEYTLSHNVLNNGNSYDVALIRLRALDDNNNLMPYYQEGYQVDVKGPIKLIGPNILSFKGGYSGLYIKSNGKPGKGSINIKSALGELNIEVEVK